MADPQMSQDDQDMLMQYLTRQSVDPNMQSHDLLSQYPQLAQAPVTPAGDFDLSKPAPAPTRDISTQGEGPTFGGGPPSDPPPQAAVPGAQANPLPSSINQVVGPKYSDDARQQLYDSLRQKSTGSMIGSAFAGLGDAISNSFGTGGQSHHLQDTIQQQQTNKNAALQEFERGRTEQLQNFDQNLKLKTAGREEQGFQLSQQQLALNRDPSSDVSTSKQALLSKYTGQPVETYQGLTGEQIDRILPTSEKAYSADQSASMKKALIQATGANRDNMAQGRIDLKSQTAAESMSKDLDPSSWSSRSAGGQASSRYNAGQRAMQLIEQGKTQPGGLDARQTQELATSVNALVSGGTSGASHEIDALVPHSLMGKARSFEEYITNNPTGLQQQDFTNRLSDTVNREMGVAQNQIQSAQAQRLGGHQWLAQNRPDLYQGVLQRTGLDPTMLDANGRLKPGPQPGQASGQYSPDVVKYAQAHNITPDQAQAIKQQRGGQ